MGYTGFESHWGVPRESEIEMTDDRVRALELALEHNRTLSHVGQADSEAKKIVGDAGLFLAFLGGEGVPDGGTWVNVGVDDGTASGIVQRPKRGGKQVDAK